MKTMISLLTTTMLAAGATSAMAFDRQASDDAIVHASVQAAHQPAHGFGGAFASARAPAQVRNSTVHVTSQYDFPMDGR